MSDGQDPQWNAGEVTVVPTLDYISLVYMFSGGKQKAHPTVCVLTLLATNLADNLADNLDKLDHLACSGERPEETMKWNRRLYAGRSPNRAFNSKDTMYITPVALTMSFQLLPSTTEPYCRKC